MSKKSFSISFVILLATITSIFLISRRGEPVVVKTNLENFPMEIAGFKATDVFFSKAVYDELDADKHVYRHYRSSDGQQVDLYIGYYGTAKGGRTGHNPYACLPSSGWGIIDTHQVRLKANNYSKGVNVNYILSRKGPVYDVVLHWYQSEGTKVLSTGIKQNIQRFIGRVFSNRNDGGFVRVSVTTKADQIEEANKKVIFFSQKVLGLLPKYWPLEK